MKKYLLENKKAKIKLEVRIIEERLDIDDFSYGYSLILNEYFDMKSKGEVKNLLEYFKEKLNDPYLNNQLEEMDFDFIYKNGVGVVTDKEGDFIVQYILKDKDIVAYVAGSYFWVEDIKNNKKYFYYAD